MRVIARSTLTRFVETLNGHKDQSAVGPALNAWYFEAAHADWRSSADVKKAFANASIIDSDRVVFNIKGNSYRLFTTVGYNRKAVFIKWLGSPKAYDLIDARKVQYGN